MPIKTSFLEACNHKPSREFTERELRRALGLLAQPFHYFPSWIIVTVTPTQWQEHQSHTREVQKQRDELNFSSVNLSYYIRAREQTENEVNYRFPQLQRQNICICPRAYCIHIYFSKGLLHTHKGRTALDRVKENGEKGCN